MIAPGKKKAKKKHVSASGQLCADKSISSNSASRKDNIKEVVNDTSKVTHMLGYFKEATLSGDFHQKLPQSASSGDDLDEREPPSPTEAGPSSLGEFTKPFLSTTVVSHTFGKLRFPRKCRHCEDIVVFKGVKCKECSLVCHQKCLEKLVIFCGHRKLQHKTQLFGAEFKRAAKKEPDGIPSILKVCVSDIEKRALCVEGIYRISGSKAQTEQLSRALQNGAHLVDMSKFKSLDICEVLMSYLRQLPEPLILFRMYKEFMDCAKQIQHINKDQETKKDKTSPNTCVEIHQVVLKCKDLVRQLPTANFNSLRYLIVHLKRVADHSALNLMNPRNLGIIFGPCLIRPRPTTAPVTISSLAEYESQALMVEFLINNSEEIFEESTEPQNSTFTKGVVAPQDNKNCPVIPVLSPEHSKNFTVKSAVIVPSAPQEIVTVSVRVSGNHSSSATQPNKPGRSAREVPERRSSDSYPLAPARAPRILQPQPWATFYIPCTPTSNVRGTEERPASPSAAVPPSTARTPLRHVEKSVPAADSTSACPLQPGAKPKDSSENRLPDMNPVCLRPWVKQTEEFVDLEVEMPQFV